MASRVAPRPKPYVSPPKPVRDAEKPRRQKPLRRVGKDRAKENRRNDQIHENFMRNNQECACGECCDPTSERHHICRGSGPRAASRFDTDTQLAVASWCHDEKFGDAEAYPVERQVALKFASILRKVNKYRGRAEKAITMKDVLQYLDLTE